MHHFACWPAGGREIQSCTAAWNLPRRASINICQSTAAGAGGAAPVYLPPSLEPRRLSGGHRPDPGGRV
jgi:hypothetical protein